MKKNLGFTLIELLVVISIIGFLATASMIVLNSTRVKARNSKRNQDIKQLMTAFALAIDNAGGTIPTTSGNWACVSSSCYEGWSSITAIAGIDAAIAPYIKKPEDYNDPTRGFGGYLFNSAAADYGQGAGATMDWLLEPVANTPGVCGPGFFYSQTANYIQCFARVIP